MANKTYIDFDPNSYDPSFVTLMADPGDGTLSKITLDQLVPRYRAIIDFTQAGTSNPVISTPFNSFPGSLTANRSSIGQYSIVTPIEDTSPVLLFCPPFGDFAGNANVTLPLSNGTSITGYLTAYISTANGFRILRVQTRNSAFALTDYSTIMDISTTQFYLFGL